MQPTSTSTKFVLDDQTGDPEFDQARVEAATIVQPQEYIAIELEGHGLACSADDTPLGEGHRSPIVIEVWEGKVRCIIWSDINQEDPTHIIELDNAQICRRECPTCGQIASHDPGCDEDISLAVLELNQF